MKGREKLPNWECLWFNLVQEEIMQRTRDGTSSKGEDEENYALAGKAKKGKGKKSNPKHIRVKGARTKTLPESSAFIVMNLGIMPRSVHTKNQAGRP